MISLLTQDAVFKFTTMCSADPDPTPQNLRLGEDPQDLSQSH